MPEWLDKLWRDQLPYLQEMALNLVAALLILIGGLWLASWLSAIVRRQLLRVKGIDGMLAGFFASMARWVMIVVAVTAVLGRFGVQTASLVAILGAAGLAVGLALQGTLSQVAAGVMLLVFRPFKLGDLVEAGGHLGEVKELNLFHTELSTLDNVQVIVPNGAVFGGPIKNFSKYPLRRVDLVFSVGYDDDLDKAMAHLLEAIAADPRALKEPAHTIAVSELGPYSISLVLRVWCKAEDYWPLRFALVKDVKERFDRAGVEIPLPTSVVQQRAARTAEAP